MSIEFRLTAHAQKQLGILSEGDQEYLLNELNSIGSARFSKIALRLSSSIFKGEKNGYVLKLRDGIRVVYKIAKSENMDEVYIVQSIFKRDESP